MQNSSLNPVDPSQKLTASSLPPAQAKSEPQTWLQWAVEKKESGLTTVISAAAGWQASAIVSAWAPKLILDSAIKQSGYILGGGLYGPAAVEAAKPVITYLAAAAGVVATGLTGAAIVGITTLGVKGVNAANAKMAERALKNEMREYQLNPANKKDFGVIAVDEWSELETNQDKLDHAKAELQKETNFNKRIALRADITKLENEVALEKFRENLP